MPGPFRHIHKYGLVSASALVHLRRLWLFCLWGTFLLWPKTGWTQLSGDYHVTQFTAREGLPQNSVRGLVFDQHGFLWVATEGGLARFDGMRMRIFGQQDAPFLTNQRIAQSMRWNDSCVAFIDHLAGVFSLTNGRFSMHQAPGLENQNLPPLKGSLPDPDAVFNSRAFAAEMAHVVSKYCWNGVSLFPKSKDTLLLISDRIALLDLSNDRMEVIRNLGNCCSRFARFGREVLQLDPNGRLFRLNFETYASEAVTLTTTDGRPWILPCANAEFFWGYPFDYLFMSDGEGLYRLVRGKDPEQYTVIKVLNRLPARCRIRSLAYRSEDGVLVLGTDTHGLFVYRPRYLQTSVFDIEPNPWLNSFYAQWLLDERTLLMSHRIVVDPATMREKQRFAFSFNGLLLSGDDKGRLYYTWSDSIYRCDPLRPEATREVLKTNCLAQCLAQVDGNVWVGANKGVGVVQGDSVRWVCRLPGGERKTAVKCLAFDPEGKLWFGNQFQLYRFDTLTGRLDTFPALANADTRTLAVIGNKLFVGTYGSGFYIYDKGRLVRMPTGSNNELTHVHAFIPDGEGFLWMPTNKGLYKTRVDAIEAYLRDSTRSVYYYAYLEEDGILNAEFNGGCSPTHVWLPDGRLSLPTIDGIVTFNPKTTPHPFQRDTIIIESIEVDGRKFLPGEDMVFPASHASLTTHFAGAWWGRSANQEIWYKLEGLHAAFQRLAVGQSSYTIGHLKPGAYRLVLRRRVGFGDADFVYSTQSFTIEAPWHAQPWALLLFALGLAALSWIGAGLYTRSIRRRNEQLQKQVNERTVALRNANAQLEANLSRLEDSERALRRNISVRDRLISIITHDILTPMRFIGLIARMGRQGKATPESLEHTLSDVQFATEKLYHSTQNMLNWVRFQQNELKPTPTNCAPFVVVEKLVEEFDAMIRFQGNTLINGVPEDDILITDPQILTIILHNLLSNAIKFTRNGHIRVSSSHADSQHYVIEVLDSGRGMTPEQVETVRQGAWPQTLSGDQAASAGNGIGLSLVFELARVIGGRCEIEAAAGAGVLARILLPMKPAEAL